MPTARSSAALVAALDELYSVDASEFVACRKRLAADLRATGDTVAAKELLAARRPTTAAWALNQLGRRAPEVLDAFLERSRALRAAQVRALSGNNDAIRDATRAQRDALSAASDAALGMVSTPASAALGAQVLATLHAASADEAVAEMLRVGRLTKEVSGGSGFPEVAGLTLVPSPEPDERAAGAASAPSRPQTTPRKAAPRKALPPSAADGPSVADARAEPANERERQGAERARRTEHQAQTRRTEAEAAWTSARDAAARAEAEAVAARERVDQLVEAVERARREARVARAAADTARREAARLARVATKLGAKLPDGPTRQ